MWGRKYNVDIQAVSLPNYKHDSIPYQYSIRLRWIKRYGDLATVVLPDNSNNPRIRQINIVNYCRKGIYIYIYIYIDDQYNYSVINLNKSQRLIIDLKMLDAKPCRIHTKSFKRSLVKNIYLDEFPTASMQSPSKTLAVESSSK